jgi:hypothetical protein
MPGRVVEKPRPAVEVVRWQRLHTGLSRIGIDIVASGVDAGDPLLR